jgi:hypothetical protein
MSFHVNLKKWLLHLNSCHTLTETLETREDTALILNSIEKFEFCARAISDA